MKLIIFYNNNFIKNFNKFNKKIKFKLMKSEREIQIEEKYKNLKNKIFYLTNKDLSVNNERAENLQYNINKLNENINSSMNN